MNKHIECCSATRISHATSLQVSRSWGEAAGFASAAKPIPTTGYTKATSKVMVSQRGLTGVAKTPG